MVQTLESVKERLKHVKKKRLVAVVVVAALGIFVWRSCFAAGRGGPVVSYLTAQADRGDIVSTLSGSGTLEPADAYTVTTLTSGEILSADFEEGDTVEEDETLYEVDSSDAASSLERAELTLHQAQRSYERALESQADLDVKSTVSGTVEEILVEAGDDVAAGQELARVRDQDTLELEIPFLAQDAQTIAAGQSAQVTLGSTFETLPGTVAAVSGANQVLTGNRIVRTVTIELRNPGAITDGTTATAQVGDLSCAGSGTLQSKGSATVTAPASGTVTNFYVSEGSRVGRDQALLHIDSDTVADQVDSAYRTLRDAEIALENQNDTLESYTITSPIHGTIVEKLYKAGDTLEAGRTLCTIYDLSYLTVTLYIDELDIGKLQEGQAVSVTADAVAGETFDGRVTNVSIKGSVSGGATTYPVTVRIDDTGGLLPGMNVDCTITTASVQDVLRIPAAAVSRGNRVLVYGEDSGGDETIPEGYGWREIAIGETDGDYVEVLSGLSEGDQITYQPADTSSSLLELMMSGGMGGAPGGMGEGAVVMTGPGM